MPEIDSVELAVIEAAKSVAKRAKKERWSGDEPWTRGLKLELAKRGKSYGFYVCGSKCEDYGRGEWLYDLVWLKVGNGTKVITDVSLIFESEWSTNQTYIDNDFQKLLLGRAQHRMMVFEQKHDVGPVFERLKDQVRNFARSQSGDRYLLLGWQYQNGTAEWRFELFVVA